MSDPLDKTAGDFDEFEVDLSQAESSVAPEGVFLGRCVGISKSMSKANNPMFQWDFEIMADENGKKIPSAGLRPKTVYTALTPKALWKLEEILVALGVAEPGGSVKFTKADVLDRFCLISIEHVDFNGRPQAEISAFKKYTGGIDKSVNEGSDVPF